MESCSNQKGVKFLGEHITDKLKWSTYTDSVVKKAQQQFFNLRRLKIFGLSPKTINLLRMHNCEHPLRMYHCLLWQLHHLQPQGSPVGGEACTTHHQRQTTCPPGNLQYPMSKEGQKDHQGQQPPKPLPVHPATIQKARSVKVHQSWDLETEKELLSQGHQTVKQPSLKQRGCCLHTDLNLLATLINGSLVTLIMPV